MINYIAYLAFVIIFRIKPAVKRDVITIQNIIGDNFCIRPVKIMPHHAGSGKNIAKSIITPAFISHYISDKSQKLGFVSQKSPAMNLKKLFGFLTLRKDK